MVSRAVPIGSLCRYWDLHIHASGAKLNNVYGTADDAVWNTQLNNNLKCLVAEDLCATAPLLYSCVKS
jgi:hypothetical protein